MVEYIKLKSCDKYNKNGTCVTNIYGDLINVYSCRSIYRCSKCGKYKKSWELDSKCKVVNFGFSQEIEN